MSNSVQTLIFDRSGFHPVDIMPQWNHISWRLNEIGVARFSLPYEDENCTTDVLKPGNRILIRFENGLPDFGGVLDFPRRRISTGVQMTAYSIEHILTWREAAKNSEFTSQTSGYIFQTLIEEMNTVWQTGISISGVYAGGVRTETYHYHALWDVISQLQRLSGEDFHFEPVYSGGRLTFQGGWYQTFGVDLSASVLLVEDRNLSQLTMDEQGPIANQVRAAGGGAGGTTWNDRLIGTAQDATSRSAYGYRERTEIMTAIFDQVTLDASAAAILAEKKDARERLSCAVLDADPAGFDKYGLGDTVQVQGFLKSAQWAIDQPMRIYGREWRPDNICTLELA